MKSTELFFSVALACVAVVASADTKKTKPHYTEEQKREIINIKTGGFIVQPLKTTVVRIYNDQKSVDKEVLDFIAVNLQKGPNFPVEVVEGPWPGEPVKEDGVGFALVISKDEGNPTKLICAPDDGYAKVNVAALMKDAPDKAKLDFRVKREIWRAICYTLGAGNTPNPMCVLKPVTSLKDLDEVYGVTSSPESFQNMIDWAKKWGINAYRRTTYRKACMEGWAPQPTNDYQRAIWKEVHELPSKPLTIEPESVKQK